MAQQRRKADNEDVNTSKRKKQRGITSVNDPVYCPDSPTLVSESSVESPLTSPPDSDKEAGTKVNEYVESPLTSPPDSDKETGIRENEHPQGAIAPKVGKVQRPDNETEINANSLATPTMMGSELNPELKDNTHPTTVQQSHVQNSISNGTAPNPRALTRDELREYLSSILKSSFDKVQMIKQINSYCPSSDKNDDSAQPIPLAVLVDAIPSDPALVVRITKLCALSGSSKIKNLALIQDPDSYASARFMKKDNAIARFFMLGVTTYSDLSGDGRNHQICMALLANLWDRAAAVVGRVYGKKTLLFSAFQNGVSFVTGWKPDETMKPTVPTVTTVTPAKTNKKTAIPSVWPWDKPVPIYDATRKPFDLAAYNKLPKFDEAEVPVSSIIMPIFTVTRFTITKTRVQNIAFPVPCDTQISFNIQAIIILAFKDELARPTDNFDVREHALGVTFLPQEEPTEEQNLPEKEDVVEPEGVMC